MRASPADSDRSMRFIELYALGLSFKDAYEIARMMTAVHMERKA